MLYGYMRICKDIWMFIFSSLLTFPLYGDCQDNQKYLRKIIVTMEIMQLKKLWLIYKS